MLTLKNIYFEINDKPLIKDVSIDFENGKMHLILGPNGAGKSTLIKLISGALKPSAGTIHFDNTNLQNCALKEQARYRAVLSQNLELSFPLKVKEVVLMGRYPHVEGHAQSNDYEICKKAMQLFNIESMKNRNYLTLSGGEKQRVQFARVFAQIWEPIEGKQRWLLLDEPLTFLDIFYQYDLMQKIRVFMQANPDLTVIGVVHDINIAAKFSDSILLMKDTQVFDFGQVASVLTPTHIYDVFKVNVEDRFELI